MASQGGLTDWLSRGLLTTQGWSPFSPISEPQSLRDLLTYLGRFCQSTRKRGRQSWWHSLLYFGKLRHRANTLLLATHQAHGFGKSPFSGREYVGGLSTLPESLSAWVEVKAVAEPETGRLELKVDFLTTGHGALLPSGII